MRSPLADKVGVLVNFETRGTSGPSLMFETSPGNGWLIPEAAKAGVDLRACSLMYSVFKSMPFNTDFNEAKRRGLRGFNVAFIDDFCWYHTLDVLGRIVRHVDVLVGDDKRAWASPARMWKAKPSWTPPRFSVIDRAVEKFPNIKIVATTLREVHSTNRHTWGAVAWINGRTFQSPTCELDVIDRVGGGDGYAAGFSTDCFRA